MAHTDTLNRRQRRFVTALMTARTIGEAAEEAGIGRRTGQRYLTQPAVKRALGQALDAVLGQVVRRAAGEMEAALDTLAAIHQNPAATDASRVSAARTLLIETPRLREALDLAERVTELEERLTGEDDE